MEQKPGEVAPQNPANPPAPGPSAEEPKVTISQKELDDLKHKAEVSSQNFERAKSAETRVKELEGAGNADLEIVPSQELQEVKGQLSEVQSELAVARITKQYPVLEAAMPDFKEWHAKEENQAMPFEAAAKVFMAEKGLLEPVRQGLEKNTGGLPAQPKQGMTAEEAKALREGDGRKYRESLLAGKVQIQS